MHTHRSFLSFHNLQAGQSPNPDRGEENSPCQEYFEQSSRCSGQSRKRILWEDLQKRLFRAKKIALVEKLRKQLEREERRAAKAERGCRGEENSLVRSSASSLNGRRGALLKQGGEDARVKKITLCGAPGPAFGGAPAKEKGMTSKFLQCR